jgi:Ser/Thr protein kinase RdoA (MazF antagonist)
MQTGTPRDYADFDGLTPELILSAVERHCGVFLDGAINPYNSYVNRVFGVTDEDEKQYIVKFYRPGRWSRETLLDEHRFLLDCARAEIPVVAPMAAAGDSGAGGPGATLGETDGFFFAVFPRVRARTFDIYGDDDWLRVGRVIGRLHAVGSAARAPNRLRLTPQTTTAPAIARLLESNLVHPDCLADFRDICAEALDIAKTAFSDMDAAAFIRIHGDCHRGNLLQRAPETPDGEGIITLLDFDDMMTGPAIQDLWLLLPGHLRDSMREINLLLEGYEEFHSFNRATLALVEPLRFMRHIYFLDWCALQRDDTGFADRNPGWGSRSFWIRETEDLATQLAVLRDGAVYSGQ